MARNNLLDQSVTRPKCILDLKTPNPTYIGQTSRLLSTRISEHRRITSDLNKCHLESCDSAVRASDFTVLESCKSTSERTIKECFYIKRLAPDLNSQVPGAMPSRKRIRLL